jgi:hypothetical protein
MHRCRFSLFIIMLFLFSCAHTSKSSKSRDTLGYTNESSSESFDDLRKKTVDEVSKIIRDNVHIFRACYFKIVRKRGGKHLSGKVTIVFQLRADGKIQRAGVKESALPITLKSCIITELWKLNFPRPYTGSPVKVNQPLSF